jgi:hypothetical protein
MTDPTQRLQHLEALHAEHTRAGRQRPATWIRGLTRDYCQEHGITPPEWCSLKRGGPPAPTLAASVAEHTGPVALPVYASLRDWAKAAPGLTSRVVCWHPQTDGAMHVSLVIVATDLDRKRSITFESEADALAQLAACTVRWAAPKKSKPKLTAGGRKRQDSAFSHGRA